MIRLVGLWRRQGRLLAVDSVRLHTLTTVDENLANSNTEMHWKVFSYNCCDPMLVSHLM